MKAKEAKEPSVSTDRILFDSTQPQTFRFSLLQKGREIPITHTVEPVGDSRFFQMHEEIEAVALRLKKLTVAMYAPKEKVWDEFVNESTGYGNVSNWKERVSQDDKVGVVNAYFEVEPDDEPVASEGELVYDFDALVEIYFSCRYGSARLLGMCHKFREITRADKDEFFSILNNQANEANIASAEKLSRVEKLDRLGRKLLKEVEGYQDGTPIPSWHLAATTEWYFLREQARQGK